MTAADKAKTVGSAKDRASLARRGVRRSGCHGRACAPIQAVTATTSMARVRAKRVKSTVFPASGGGEGGRPCGPGLSWRGWKKWDDRDMARLRIQPESWLRRLKAHHAEMKVQTKRSRVIDGVDRRNEALLRT